MNPKHNCTATAELNYKHEHFIH